MLVWGHCSNITRNNIYEGALRTQEKKRTVQQGHNVTDKSCIFLLNRGFRTGCLLPSTSHLHHPFAVNFTDDVLIALQLISLLCSLPTHSLNTARLIFLMHCFLWATPLPKRSYTILPVLKMSNEQTQPPKLTSRVPFFLIDFIFVFPSVRNPETISDNLSFLPQLAFHSPPSSQHYAFALHLLVLLNNYFLFVPS